jgi:hypothetical protein
VFGCAVYAQKAKSIKSSNYHEDLSIVRPVFESIVAYDTSKVVHDDSLLIEGTDMEVSHEIDSIIQRIEEYNLEHPPKLKGYRIQVYSGGNQTDAQNAIQVATEVLGEDIYHKIKWSSPVFRSRVGCYLTRLEAYRAFLLLEIDFPNALVVPENSIDPSCVK